MPFGSARSDAKRITQPSVDLQVRVRGFQQQLGGRLGRGGSQVPHQNHPAHQDRPAAGHGNLREAVRQVSTPQPLNPPAPSRATLNN